MNIKPISYRQNTTFGCAANKIIPTRLSQKAIDEICVAYRDATGKVLNPKLLQGDYFVKPNSEHTRSCCSWATYACIFKDNEGNATRQVEYLMDNDNWNIFLIREFTELGEPDGDKGEIMKYYDSQGNIESVQYCGPLDRKIGKAKYFDFDVLPNGDVVLASNNIY